MKRLSRFISIGLLAGSAHAQQSFIQTGESIVLPFEITAAMLQSSELVTDIQLLTASSVQGRGVAGREVLMDELIALAADISAGIVHQVQDVRQVALREIFSEIEHDEILLRKIDQEIKAGNRLDKLVTAITLSLLKN